MEMARARRFPCLLLTFLAVSVASSILPNLTEAESLKSALDAVTRKQRSLDVSFPEYYDDLKNFKYRPVNDNEFSRQARQDIDDEEDEDLEFLPNDNGQMEMVGDGYRNLKEQLLLNYLKNSDDQEDVAPSPFRERLRNGGHKRSVFSNRHDQFSDRRRTYEEALFRMLLKKYPDIIDDPEYNPYLYPKILKPIDDKERNDKQKSSQDEVPWDEIFSTVDKNRDYLLKNEGEDEEEESFDVGNHRPSFAVPAERRNVNARYPIGRDYGLLFKRFPMSKRSAKPLHHDEKDGGAVGTDPKVAKDLGALFGGQTGAESSKITTEKKEHSGHEHDHSGHEHDHSGHEHDHSGHEHDHSGAERDHSGAEHDHSGADHNHSGHEAKSTMSPGGAVTTSEAPKSMINSPKASPGMKEITGAGNREKTSRLLSKRNNRNVEITKKNIDWSQYFGMDRRKKKAALLVRPGSQQQDDEWMLQSYYKTMAENLKNSEREDNKDNEEKRDRFDQMDTRLKNVKNLIVEDALKYNGDGNSDPQEVKDIVMARLAAAYSLEKMRKALDEFRKNIATQRELMRTAHAKNESDHEDDDRKDLGEKKRGGHGLFEDVPNFDGRNNKLVSNEGTGCTALDQLKDRCPALGPNFEGLRNICVLNLICRACDDKNEECGMIFASALEKICETVPFYEKRSCIETFSILGGLQPSPFAVATCHLEPDSCLRRSENYLLRSAYYRFGKD